MEQMTWFSWWGDADWVVRGVFVALVAMSLAGWAVILHKMWQLGRLTRIERRLGQSLDDGGDRSSLDGHAGPSAAFAPVLGSGLRGDDLTVRLAQTLRELRIELEQGLVVLATIGNVAPFVGLLGTVWGIMHALQGLSSEAALSLAMVGGPVAEALVATAAGLFAAIPAVIGYNFLLRKLARLMILLEGNARRLADAVLLHHQHQASVTVLRQGEVH